METAMKECARALSRALIVLLALLAVLSPAANAQETTVLMQENFEGQFANDPNCQDGTCDVPQGWRVWFIPHRDTDPQGVNYPPAYARTDDPRRVKSGAGAQRLFTQNRTFTAGIYRVVSNVKVGSKLRFSMWGQSWSTNDNSPISARPSSDIRLRIGIDPAAEGDPQPSPFNGRVIWSAEQDAKDAFAQFTVEAEAKTGTVIVWTYATMKDVVRHNEVFWDDALLEVIAPAPTAQPASDMSAAPTPTPEEPAAGTGGSEAAAAQMTGGVTYTVKQGDTLFGIALAYNKDVDELRRLNQLDSDLLSIGQVLVIEPPVAQAPSPTQPPPDAGSPAAQPEPAVAQAETTPLPEGQPTPTPSTGALCVQAYSDDNGNGARDAGESLVAGILFSVTSGGESKGTYISDGDSEPYCFTELPVGAYTVAATIGSEYVSTTPLNDTASVRGGVNALFSLGLRRADAAHEVIQHTPTPASAPAEGAAGPNLLAILATVSGALIILGTVGFGVLFFLQSRRL